VGNFSLEVALQLGKDAMTVPNQNQLPTLLFAPPRWMRLFVGPLMTAVFLVSEVSRIGTGRLPFRQGFAWFARKRVTPIRYATAVVAVSLIPNLAGVAESALKLTVPGAILTGPLMTSVVLLFLMKLTYRAQPSPHSPFLLSNALREPGVQRLHLRAVNMRAANRPIRELAALIAASRPRLLVMDSPLLVQMDVNTGGLARLIAELRKLSADVTITRREPRAMSRFAMAAFWPLRQALASTPKWLRTARNGEVLLTAAIEFDLRWTGASGTLRCACEP